MTEASKHGGMADSGLLIDMRNVVKTYIEGEPSELTVLHGVDFYADQGEFVSLIGPSGCGKSTLLRMIVGLEDITSGDMMIGDKPVNDMAPRDRNLAMVFQNYALYPHMTVYDNLAFGLKLFQRIGAGRFGQAIVRRRSFETHADERFRHELGDAADRIRRHEFVVAHDGAHRLERKAAAEYRQTPEDGLRACVE